HVFRTNNLQMLVSKYLHFPPGSSAPVTPMFSSTHHAEISYKITVVIRLLNHGSSIPPSTSSGGVGLGSGLALADKVIQVWHSFALFRSWKGRWHKIWLLPVRTRCSLACR